jgi:hypothetical protein
MRLIVTQTECAGNLFWIVRDTDHSWFYHGPFEDEITARAFARPKNSEAWKELLRTKRAEQAAKMAGATTAYLKAFDDAEAAIKSSTI